MIKDSICSARLMEELSLTRLSSIGCHCTRHWAAATGWSRQRRKRGNLAWRTASYPAHPPSPQLPHLLALESSQGLRCQVRANPMCICKKKGRETLAPSTCFNLKCLACKGNM